MYERARRGVTGPIMLHTEGRSQLFAFSATFGHLPWHLHFPAASGLNPYEPERGRLASTFRHHPNDASLTGCKLSVHVYDILRGLPEHSRGIGWVTLRDRLRPTIRRLLQKNDAYRVIDASPASENFLRACLVRGINYDNTFATYIRAPDPRRPGSRSHQAAVAAAQASCVAGWAAANSDTGVVPDLQVDPVIYFNLSASERKRLRVFRRMSYVIARQLVLRKNKKGSTPLRRLLALETAPEELLRVVVSFL